ncbi:MAG: DUF2779 domain-containing protein [Cytophagales bacterium]|nr:DUF2779 domain-containing protein [Cytophagales bacterium]
MNQKEYTLSRSSFAKGLQCTKQLFLLNKGDLSNKHFEVSDEQRAIKKRTVYLRKLAQKLFPKGVDAQEGCDSYEQSAEKTEKLIKLKHKVLYNAVFIANNAVVVIDIMVWRRGSWTAYEVKAGTKVTKGGITFAAFKWNVLKEVKAYVNDFSFIVLNKEYYRGEKLILTQCFKRVSKFQEIKEASSWVARQMKRYTKVLQKEEVPEVEINKRCLVPYECRIKSYCWKNVPENSVFDLVGSQQYDKFNLYHEGVETMEQLLESENELKLNLSENQKLQIKSSTTGRSYLKQKEMIAFLQSIQYPLIYLDFESYQPFLPREKGMSPLQQCVFQYSIHTQQERGGELSHIDFLHLPNDERDVRLVLLEKLLKDTKEAKTILVYDVSFEKYYLNYLIQVFPRYRIAIEELMNKMVDLVEPFAQKYIYTPEMKGLHSMKAVLPALIPNMDYKGLNLQNGLMASLAYAQWAEGMFEGDEEKLLQDLKDYCTLDTYAMTQVMDVLYGLV